MNSGACIPTPCLSECWFTNGQIQAREYFKDGVSHGLREKWHENGSRLSQATIVEGQVIGTSRSWHDNGRLSEQIEMKLGQADGIAWAWYPSGFVKAETTVQNGRVLDRKIWKDGEQAAPGFLDHIPRKRGRARRQGRENTASPG